MKKTIAIIFMIPSLSHVISGHKKRLMIKKLLEYKETNFKLWNNTEILSKFSEQEIIELNNMRLQFSIGSLVRIGLNLVGFVADVSTIVDMYKSMSGVSHVSNNRMACSAKSSPDSILPGRSFPTTTQPFCAVRSIRGNLGYDPDSKGTVMFFRTQDDVITYTSCIKQRTGVDIELKFDNLNDYRTTYINDFIASELSMLSESGYSCLYTTSLGTRNIPGLLIIALLTCYIFILVN